MSLGTPYSLPELLNGIGDLGDGNIFASNCANLRHQSGSVVEILAGDSLIEADLLAKIGIDACDCVPYVVARAPRELGAH